MAFDLTWSIEGETQLVRRLQKIGDNVKNAQPAFKEASDNLKQIFANDVFNTQGAVIGEHWNPLSPRYLAQKVKAGYPAEPLVRTGAMKNAFQTIVKADSATVWNAIAYFKYHQSNKPRHVLPRRVMMKLGNEQKEMVVKVFHTYLYKLSQKNV